MDDRDFVVGALALPVMPSLGMLYVVSRSMAVLPVWSWCWFSGSLMLAGDAVHGDCWGSHLPVMKKAACGEAEADFHPV